MFKIVSMNVDLLSGFHKKVQEYKKRESMKHVARKKFVNLLRKGE